MDKTDWTVVFLCVGALVVLSFFNARYENLAEKVFKQEIITELNHKYILVER